MFELERVEDAMVRIGPDQLHQAALAAICASRGPVLWAQRQRERATGILRFAQLYCSWLVSTDLIASLAEARFAVRRYGDQAGLDDETRAGRVPELELMRKFADRQAELSALLQALRAPKQVDAEPDEEALGPRPHRLSGPPMAKVIARRMPGANHGSKFRA